MRSDPEYIDEMERKGDSLLDEERWQSDPELCSVCGQPDNCGDCDHTPIRWWVNISAFAQRDVILRWGVAGRIVAEMTQDEARNLANAILSEIEIAQREERGDW